MIEVIRLLARSGTVGLLVFLVGLGLLILLSENSDSDEDIEVSAFFGILAALACAGWAW